MIPIGHNPDRCTCPMCTEYRLSKAKEDPFYRKYYLMDPISKIDKEKTLYFDSSYRKYRDVFFERCIKCGSVLEELPISGARYCPVCDRDANIKSPGTIRYYTHKCPKCGEFSVIKEIGFEFCTNCDYKKSEGGEKCPKCGYETLNRYRYFDVGPYIGEACWNCRYEKWYGGEKCPKCGHKSLERLTSFEKCLRCGYWKNRPIEE